MLRCFTPYSAFVAIVGLYVAARYAEFSAAAEVAFLLLLACVTLHERNARRRTKAVATKLQRSDDERRNAVHEWSESDRLLQMTEQTASIGHWEVDLRTQQIFWSDETFRIHGQPPGKAPDLEAAIAVYHPEDRQIVVDNFERAVETGTGYTFQARLVRADGEIRQVESIARVQCDDEGTSVRLFGVFRDRTDELARQRELTAALSRARYAVAAKSRFLANMSHEIRTPMNGVIGFTDLLLREELTATQRRYVSLIRDSGRSMLTLLNDILDISKIEAGSLELAKEEIVLRDKLESCLAIMMPMASEKAIDLSMNIDPDVPLRFEGDRLRFRQIVLNLIANAIKFTDEGGVCVTARMKDDSEDDVLLVEVRDTGVGIQEKQLESIFANFRQADATTARRFGGTGLGLPISRNLARLMGGDVHARANSGPGSTFTIELPVRILEHSDAVAIDAPATMGTIARDVSLLVVEDNAVNQVLIEAMCQKLGVDVAIASTGLDAIDCVRHARDEARLYDLVFMDLQMPQMDGFEATRRLRALGFDAGTLPIVALTANAYAEDVEACLEAGMQDHLTKPITLEQVDERIARYSDKSSAQVGKAAQG
ncbi:ATP-binding protein [Sphingomicrobium sp. XHP0235]|uniref:ATP-binding protein n=1 Tax=Sphingomicrobium aquimarinum TaxID=3133971 RepID=UPI0031FE6BCC